MDGVLCPFVINPFYFCGPDGKEPWVADRAPHPVDRGAGLQPRAGWPGHGAPVAEQE